jgi:phage gp29-like protein
LAAAADPEIAAMVEVVQAELGRAESLEEFNDRLITLFPELDGGPLAEQLATAMAAARLAGRAAVVDEIAEAEAQEDA